MEEIEDPPAPRAESTTESREETSFTVEKIRTLLQLIDGMERPDLAVVERKENIKGELMYLCFSSGEKEIVDGAELDVTYQLTVAGQRYNAEGAPSRAVEQTSLTKDYDDGMSGSKQLALYVGGGWEIQGGKSASDELGQSPARQASIHTENSPTQQEGTFNPEQWAEKVEEFEALCTDFERTHNLDTLNAIQVHTVEEARSNVARESAKKDLPPLVTLRNFIMEQDEIPQDIKSRINARYKAIQAAVGALNNGQLDHSIRW